LEFLGSLVDLVVTLFDYFLHLDRHMAELVQEYGNWIYLILFAIVFCETGLIVTPFLPGDSLLFIAGTLAAVGGMNVHLVVALLIVAATLGDAVNYGVGRYLGSHWLENNKSRFIKREYIDKTHAFYEKYGGMTIIIARFVPIVRTYAPFVAGVSGMTYRKFALYNVSGAAIWVVSVTYLGYFFGNVPWIRQNQGFVAIGIIFVSVLPILWGWIKARREARQAQPAAKS
jgi:membrane-associated protein